MKHFILTALFITSITLVFAVSDSFAHEGHDHDAPAAVQAPKGGLIKSLESTHVEVVSKGKELVIYLYDKDLKPKAIQGFFVTASAQMPRTKKTEKIALVAKETSYEAQFDGKGIHRYTLILSVKDPSEGHADELKFTIEPKK